MDPPGRKDREANKKCALSFCHKPIDNTLIGMVLIDNHRQYLEYSLFEAVVSKIEQYLVQNNKKCRLVQGDNPSPECHG